MEAQNETWQTPEFEVIEANMECTAYSSGEEAEEYVR